MVAAREFQDDTRASAAAPELRLGSAADVPAAAAILTEWLEATPWMPRLHGPDAIEAFMAEALFARNEVLIAAERGCVTGYLVLGFDGFVPGLTVRADARGRGIGRALIDWAKRRRRRLGLWCFEANLPARRFYAREGFVEIGRTEGENDERLPDIHLVWERGR